MKPRRRSRSLFRIRLKALRSSTNFSGKNLKEYINGAGLATCCTLAWSSTNFSGKNLKEYINGAGLATCCTLAWSGAGRHTAVDLVSNIDGIDRDCCRNGGATRLGSGDR